MRLTKDEARILSAALSEYKFENVRSNSKRLFERLTDLENRLYRFGQDKRRLGRTSQDDWSDLLKRFANSKKNKQ